MTARDQRDQPTIVAGMTNEQLIDALPELVDAATERAPDLAATLRQWSREWLRAWNTHDLDAVLALVTDDIVCEDPSLCGERVAGKPAFRDYVEMTWRAFPDIHFELASTPYLSLLGTGMAAPWRARGTFTGDMGGGPSPVGIAATGRRFDTTGVDLYELRDGLLCTWVSVADLTELARQLGMMPGARSPLFRLAIRVQRLGAPLLRGVHRYRQRRAQRSACG
ncbi:nuclear transport factor 2 family protein [Nocardia sp. NPDC005366]|uniref:ester cyclase n=1 Tax=Nocardia sp. NPDC005366 TaxID=3156878 RepID=UPI0033A1B839